MLSKDYLTENLTTFYSYTANIYRTFKANQKICVRLIVPNIARKMKYMYIHLKKNKLNPRVAYFNTKFYMYFQRNAS